MNKLEELRKLAEEMQEKGKALDGRLGQSANNAGTYVVQVRNDTILALLDLIDLQHEAILWNWGGEPLPTKERAAIDAYNNLKEQSWPIKNY